jgi:hypothetical protein
MVMKNLTVEQQEFWRRADPEFWADIDTMRESYQAPVRIERAFAQKLTTWSDELNLKGRGQFQFNVGDKNSRQKITLNFAWGKTGPGGTHTLNRWYEEIQCLLRNEPGIKMYKATAYLPNTQDYQTWCQFIEVRKFNMPIQAYCVWNGDTIITSKANPVIRDTAYDWTFDWRNAQPLEQMLFLVKDLG